MKLYQAMHCPCIYESAYYTISIHKTKEGAEKVINENKANALKEAEENNKIYLDSLEEGEEKQFWVEYYENKDLLEHESWTVEEIEVQE